MQETVRSPHALHPQRTIGLSLKEYVCKIMPCGEPRCRGTFWSGLIDDVRIYNAALSAEEVAALAR